MRSDFILPCQFIDEIAFFEHSNSFTVNGGGNKAIKLMISTTLCTKSEL